MADRSFDIEILIKARNAASKVLNDLARDVGKAEDKFEDFNKKTASVNRTIGALETKLDGLKTRTSAYSRETLTAANRMEKFNDRFKDMGRNVSQLNRDFEKLHTGTTQVLRQLDNSIEQLNKRMVANVVASRQAGESTGDLESELKSLDIEYKKKPADVDKASRSVDNFGRTSGRTSAQSKALAKSLKDLGDEGNRSGGGLNNLVTSVNRFQVAAAIKYTQALTTAAVALGGELVAVSGSAISAGAALGAGLATGAAQAIGPVALLAATLSRITAVGKILNLKKQIDDASAHTAARGGGPTAAAADEADRLAAAQDRVASSNEQLIGAEERVKNAHDAVEDAQRKLTQTRVDATRQLEQLIDAEKRARLAQQGSNLSLEEAERQRRHAQSQGGAAFAEADLDVDRARLDVTQARQDALRATQDRAKAQRQGVDNNPDVIGANRALQDANRQLAASHRAVDAAQRSSAAAARQVSKAHREAATGAIADTAAEDRLRVLLGKLSPAERDLVASLEKLHTVYAKAFRPITDVIIASFSNAVDKVIPLFSNPKILGAFTDLAASVSQIIDQISDDFTSIGRQNFLADVVGDSADTLPKLADGARALADAFIDIAKEGKPIFDFLVETAVKLAEDFNQVTDNTTGLKKFFAEGKQDLQGLFDLAGAVFNLFTAIFDPARDTGRSTIKDAAKDLNQFADNLHNNQEGVRRFFEQSRQVFNDIVGVVFHLGRVIFEAFEPASVHAFADFLNNVIIPAIADAVEAIGKLTRTFHAIFAGPVISDLSRIIVTFALITSGLSIINSVFIKVGGTIKLFYLGLIGGRSISVFRAAIVGVSLIMSTFDRNVGLMKAAVVVFLGALSVVKIVSFFRAITVGVAQLGGLAAGASLANPWLALLEVIGLVAGAIFTLTHSFKSNTTIQARSVDEVTDSINAQKDALRDLRDLEIEGKNRKLDVASAESRLARARHDEAQKAAQVKAPGSQAGETITKKEARDLRDLRIARQQAENDLERARRNLNRFGEDTERVHKTVESTTRKETNGRRTDLEVAEQQVKKAQEKVDKLKEETKVGDRFNEGIGVRRRRAEELSRAEDDLKDKTRAARTAHDNLATSVHNAAKEFTNLGGNAESFGLTFDDVLHYLESGTNDGLKEFGAKPVHFAKNFTPRSRSRSGNSASSLIPGFGDVPQKAQGGILEGWGLHDTVPVWAAPGEGFLTRHQMPIVDDALRYSGMSGGLNELFSSVSTPHWMARGGRAIQKFASGGPIDLHGAKPGLAVYAKFAEKFGLHVSSGKDDHDKFVSGTNRVSQHFTGDAIDVADGAPAMLRAAKAIVARFGKGLDQLIHTPLGYSINKGKKVPPFSQADHYDHIHIGDSTPSGSVGGLVPGAGDVADATAAAEKFIIPHIRTGGPAGGLTTLLDKASNSIRAQANKLIREKAGSSGPSTAGTSTAAAGVIPGAGEVIGNINRRFKKHFSGQPGAQLSESQVKQVAGSVHFPSEMVGIAKRESGWHPGIIGRDPGGTLGYGLWQNTTSVNGPAFEAVVNKLGGWDEMLNPYKNARAAKWLYDRGGLSHWAATRARGGVVKAKNAMGKVANFARGGAVGHFQSGGGVPRTPFLTGSTKATIFQPFLDDISAIANKKSPLGLLLKALRDLTAEDGPLASFAQEFTNFQSRLATNLQNRIFKTKKRPGGGVIVTKTLDDVEQAGAELENIQAERVELREQGRRVGTADRAALIVERKSLKELRKAQKSRDPKAIAKAAKNYNQALADRRGIKGQKLANRALLAQNAEDIFRKQEEIEEIRKAKILEAEQAAIDANANSFNQIQFGLDVQDRTNAAFGNQSNNAGLTAARRGAVGAQIGNLQGLLGKTTDPGLRTQLQDQINQLSLQMIDLAAKFIDDQLETVTRSATLGQAAVDRTLRVADIVSKTTAGSNIVSSSNIRASALNTRGGVLAQQIAGLAGVLAQLPAGSDKAEDIRQQMADLQVSIQENNLAIRDNTDQLQASIFERGQGVSGFLNNTISNGISLVETIGTLLGNVVDNPTIINLLGIGKKSLTSQRASLNSQLESRFGLSVSSLSGQKLIDKLVEFSSIDTSAFSPAQEALFRNLINALLENETAIVANTKKLQEITAAQNIQSFNSTSWQLFRNAVFNGANGLVPSLANLTPMATGGMVKSGGAFWLHPGEKVLSAKEVTNSGETHNWYIETPTEILDPDYISTVMSFKRNNTRATQ